MNIPDSIRKCVAFLATEGKDQEKKVIGSVFFVGFEDEGGVVGNTYAVTARHNIEAIQRLGRTKVLMRLNQKLVVADWYETKTDEWYYHPSDGSVDVAVRPLSLPITFDHLVFPVSLFLNDEIARKHEIGLGDEVLVTGLFRHHYGNHRNIPIIRTGNIAGLHEEKVVTQRFGEIDAHLIECRSIGGLSGSPVFVNIGLVRLIENQIKFTGGANPLFLFGLIHGHFDSKTSEIDGADGIDASTEQVNTGIAIVVPVEKILEVIQSCEGLGIQRMSS